MAEGYVRVPPDSSGKYIDTTEKYNANNVLVERQRVEIPDEVEVSGDLLTQILIEQRVQNLLLVQGLNVNADVDGLRDELTDIAISDSGRIQLTADTTYNVPSEYSTIQVAYDYICSALDKAGFDVTIKVTSATTTYATTVPALNILQPWVGGGGVIIEGDTVTPSNVKIVCDAVPNGIFTTSAPLAGILTIRGFKLTCTTSGYGVFANTPGPITLSSIEWAGCAGGDWIAGAPGAFIYATGTHTISTGNAGGHQTVNSSSFGFIDATVTLTGSPVFSTAFAIGEYCALMMDLGTYSGATGASSPRFSVSDCAVLEVFGAGVNHFPGDTPGTEDAATFGVYH